MFSSGKWLSNFKNASDPEAYFKLATEISNMGYFIVFPYMNLTLQKSILVVFNTIQSQVNSNPKMNAVSNSSVNPNTNLFWKIGPAKVSKFITEN